jgi:hypothetical protein
MKVALHPFENTPISVDQYWELFGHRPLLAADSRPRARCPFCPQPLNDVAGKSQHTTGHFAHLPSSAPCPSKEPAGVPYIRLTPTSPDPQRSQWLKAQFFDNWEKYYRKLEDLVPCLALKEFFALITEANRLRIWEYRLLEPWEIPYVFVLMFDFPVTNSRTKDSKPLRKFWFRFWYDAAISSLDDLWIHRNTEPTLFRASYPQPARRGAIPGSESIVRFYPIQRDRGYLTVEPEHELPAWVKQEVGLRLPRLLGISA